MFKYVVCVTVSNSRRTFSLFYIVKHDKSLEANYMEYSNFEATIINHMRGIYPDWNIEVHIQALDLMPEVSLDTFKK